MCIDLQREHHQLVVEMIHGLKKTGHVLGKEDIWSPCSKDPFSLTLEEISTLTME